MSEPEFDSGTPAFDELVKRRYTEFPALERRVAEQDAEIARLNAVIDSYNRLNDEKNGHIVGYQAEIARMKTSAHDVCAREIAQLMEEAREKDAEIAQLKETIAVQEKSLNFHAENRDKQDKLITELADALSYHNQDRLQDDLIQRARGGREMKTVYKYVFDVSDEEREFDYFGCRLGENVVGLQNGKVCLWQVVSDGPGLSSRWVGKVVGTGQWFDSNWVKIGTAFDPPFVWHLIIRPMDLKSAMTRGLRRRGGHLRPDPGGQRATPDRAI